VVSFGGLDAEHWPVIVEETFVSCVGGGVVVVLPGSIGGQRVELPWAEGV